MCIGTGSSEGCMLMFGGGTFLGEGLGLTVWRRVLLRVYELSVGWGLNSNSGAPVLMERGSFGVRGCKGLGRCTCHCPCQSRLS